MKFSSVLTIFAIAVTSASALSFQVSYNDQKPIGLLDEEIPGNSPVKICSKDPDLDTVAIERVDLDPNPPTPGNTLHIEASGQVLERIEEGAYIVVLVKLGYITLIKKTFDFCEEVKQVDLECPIEKGPVKITKDVDLPKQIPPGKFVVTANLFTVNDVLITCLSAEVNFAKAK